MTNDMSTDSDRLEFIPDRKLRSILRGALAGTAATVPMSLLMLSAQKAGLMGKQPPERITEAILDKVGIRHRSESVDNSLATVNHFFFGAAAGALYGVLRRERVPEVVQGIVYGLGVWITSYKGWLPALDLMPSPEHDRPGRQTSTIAAHVLFGASLGVTYRALRGH